MKTRDLIKILTELAELIPENAERGIFNDDDSDINVEFEPGMVSDDARKVLRSAGWTVGSYYAYRDIS